jgi:signal transduction histidine kinase/DNA-binding NarL/FixJ family response regulator
MKTLLVLAQHPDLPQALQSLLSSEQFRVVHRLSVDDAEPLLSHRAVDACIIDSEGGAVQGIWGIEKLRRRYPLCPVVVFTASKTWDWEEEAYAQGVSYILTKPVRARTFNVILDRVFKANPAPVTNPVRAAAPPPPQGIASQPQPSQTVSDALEELRDFSSILAHSLRADDLFKQFLLRLREVIGVNRATIFLKQTITGAGTDSSDPQRTLRSACSIGLPAGLLESYDLSIDAGVGAFLYRTGRMLRRESVEVLADPRMQREFELMGAEVAIPIMDRETMVGVAALDARVTGEPLTNSELELIFHLLEELGLAVKNVWIHDQLAANHEMLADILRELSSACVVVGRDLTVLHANKMARQYFARAGRRGADLEFTDLPMILGSKVYQVLKTGTAIETFKYHPTESPKSVYYVTLVPFQRKEGLPSSVLLIVEDRTQSEQLQRLEVETASLRLIRSMADRMAHEIGNALVPLATHQQLMGERYKDPEFRASLDQALADGVKRITRLTSQMRFLARDSVTMRETLPLRQLVEEAYSEARKHFPGKGAKLKWNAGDQTMIVSGDQGALRHAISEVLLNAFQANPADAQVEVNARADSDASGVRWVHIEVQDHGAGFPAESLSRLPEPFFTTRNVGLGLGLTVSRKIIETHHGKLTLTSSEPDHSGLVRISLPLADASSGKG